MDGGRIARWARGGLPLTGAVLVACGSHAAQPAGRSAPPVTGAVVGCEEGGATSRPLSPEERVASVTSGPLTLVYVRDNATQPAWAFLPVRQFAMDRAADRRATPRERRLARRTLRHARPGSYAITEGLVHVATGSEATVAVAPSQRDAVSLIFSRQARNRERHGARGAYRVRDGDAQVTFRACPNAATDFLGGYVVAGARCVHLTVTSPGRPAEDLALPFGGRRCAAGRRAVRPWRLVTRTPYLGVACPHPNSLACDRVGLAVWLAAPAARVRATVQGQPLALRATRHRRDALTFWEGFLQPAGLLDGPLKVTPDQGRYGWVGRHPRDATVTLDVLGLDGRRTTTRLRVPLRPGWG